MDLRYIILFFLLGWGLIACSNQDVTEEITNLCGSMQDSNSSEIISSYQLGCNIELNSTYIISNEQEWKSILSNCADLEIPQVDFELQDVLGITIGASGCQRFYERKYELHVEEKTAQYKVIYYTCGLCEPYVMNTQWIVVDKIPSDFEVLIFAEEA